MRSVAAAVMCVLLWGCGGGRAVRVDCDGPLVLINPPAGPTEESSVAPPATAKPLSDRKQGRHP